MVKKQEEENQKRKKQEDAEDNSLYFIFKNIKNKAGKGIEPISTTDYVVALPLSYPAKSPTAVSNHRPSHYKCDALPLS